MYIEQGLFTFLTGQAAIATMVGTRIYPVRLKKEPTTGRVALPAITYTRIDATRIRSHSGPSNLVAAMFEVNTWANGYDEARGLGDLVVEALDCYKGMMGFTEVGAAFVDSDPEFFDADLEAYRVAVTTTIWYRPL